MTVRDVLAAMGRRWYVFLAVLLAFGALTYTLYRDGGSFYSHATITFTLPARAPLLPDSGRTDTSVIAFAGAIATQINEGKPAPAYSSADAPYYGAGVRQGVMVSLRNDGNQWIASFPTATIDIQIVGQTRQWVADRQQQLLSEIVEVSRAQQSAMVTPAADQITATVQPLSTQIDKASSTQPTRLLAVAAMALAGIIVGGWAAVSFDRLVRRVRRRARRRTARGEAASLPAPARTGGYSA